MNKFWEDVNKIEFKIFNYTLWVCYTNDIVEARKGQNNCLGPCKEDKNIDGLHSYNKHTPGQSAIFFTPDSSIGVIAHEIFHALWAMFKYIGAKLENEVVAYHLSFTLDTVLEYKNKKDKKCKK